MSARTSTPDMVLKNEQNRCLTFASQRLDIDSKTTYRAATVKGWCSNLLFQRPAKLRLPVLAGLLIAMAWCAQSQTPRAPSTPASPRTPAGPLQIDLPQAISRARQYGGQVQGANLALAQATQDRVQARAAALPQVTALSQYIYTQGNGTPSGVFVSNDGVHVYNDQGLVHQDVLSLTRHGEQLRAAAAEAVARAKVDVAARGLNATVIQNFYAIANALHKQANASLSLSEARNFLDITRKQEAGGEVAHADVVKAQLAMQQRQIDLNESQTTLAKAKIALAVIIFPDVSTDFSITDDLAETEAIPPAPPSGPQFLMSNPDVKVANASVDQAGYDVAVARYAYLPTIGIDLFYGLNSNVVGWHNREGDRNVGAAAQITVNIPVWNWGATRSKVKQAELKQDQARLDLLTAQRTLNGSLATARAEAEGASTQVALLRDNVTAATESLRLTLLRYQAGESTAFEVSDAQSTLKQARDAYDDGLSRYRIALASLHSLLGTL